MLNIIDEISKDSLKSYLMECAKHADIDIDLAFITTVNFSKRHDGKPIKDSDIEKMLFLEEKWYASLEKNEPDYSVYSDPYYFCEVWLCWSKYSRRYLKDITSPKSLFGKSIVSDMRNVNTVLDLGCGFGYTTAALKQIFPTSAVYGTNLEESSQYLMAKNLSSTYDFSVISTHKNTKADLIFASEYFEHFDRPIEHLIDILDNSKPKYMLIANTFNGKAIGHFNQYYHLGETYSGKEISKKFNNTLRDYGYEKVKTKCWNSRPAYWKLNESNLSQLGV